MSRAESRSGLVGSGAFVAREPKSRGPSGTYPAEAKHHAEEQKMIGSELLTVGFNLNFPGPVLGLGMQGDKKETGKKSRNNSEMDQNELDSTVVNRERKTFTALLQNIGSKAGADGWLQVPSTTQRRFEAVSTWTKDASCCVEFLLGKLNSWQTTAPGCSHGLTVESRTISVIQRQFGYSEEGFLVPCLLIAFDSSFRHYRGMIGQCWSGVAWMLSGLRWVRLRPEAKRIRVIAAAPAPSQAAWRGRLWWGSDEARKSTTDLIRHSRARNPPFRRKTLRKELRFQ